MSNTTATQKAALWVGIVFLLGAALGGMLGYVFAHRSYASAPAPVPPVLSDAEHRAQKVQKLTQELNLNADQQKQIDAIIGDAQDQYKAIHKSIEPQLDDARQKGRDRIRAVLTPDQLPKFEVFLKKIDDERKKNAPK